MRDGTHAPRLGLLFIALTVSAACTSTETVVCPGGRVCPVDTQCVLDPRGGAVASEDDYLCATEAETTPCLDKADQDDCGLDGTGRCFSGICFPAVCGDTLVEPGEVCDDGNVASGDACSSDCTSTEVCGDGTVNASVGEQCDEGRPGFSGDGCSSVCRAEFRLWRSVRASTPPSRQFYALTPEPHGRGVLLFGGAELALGPLPGGTAMRDMWRWDGALWLEVPQPQRPSARGGAAVATDATNEQVVLFGGFTAALDALGDTWVWDGVTWTDAAPAVTPPPRGQGAFACGAGRCVLFGGWLGTLGSELGDTWVWDGTTWMRLPTGTTRPSPRAGAALVFDPVNQRFVLHGGVATKGGSRGAVGETWVLDTSGWRMLVMGTSPDLSRNDAVLRGLYQRGDVQIAVGTREPPFSAASTTLWKLAISTTTVNSVVIETANWTASSATRAALLNVTVDPIRDVVVAQAETTAASIETANVTWTDVTPLDPGEPGTAVTAAYDPLRARTLVVGLYGTLSWNGQGFERLVAPDDAKALPELTQASLAYDTTCDQAILVGGRDKDDVTRAEAWRFKDGEWSAIAAAPAPRRLAMMTYDAARGRVVLFGGLDESGLSVDTTWELDSTSCASPTWVVRSGGDVPPDRFAGMLTYDPVRQVSVLHGGAHLGGFVAGPPEIVGDTWLWDGMVWSPRASAGGPGRRAGHAAAFEPRSGRVIMTGGVSTNNVEADTWSLLIGEDLAATWQPVDVVVAPEPRRGFVLVRDAAGLLAIGGEGGQDITVTGTPLPMARLTSEGLDPPERCLASGDDADGDAVRGCDDPDCWLRCDPTCVPTDTSATTCALDLSRPRCGDLRCDEPREDYALCPSDCMMAP